MHVARYCLYISNDSIIWSVKEFEYYIQFTLEEKNVIIYLNVIHIFDSKD